MAYLRAFGSYLPSRVVDNEEMSKIVGGDPDKLQSATGIEQRRWAADDETVASMGVAAAKDCLDAAGVAPADVGMVVVGSGSADRRFPGPAAVIASALGLSGPPAVDLPMASAGSLFGMALAAQMAPMYKHVLVIGSEIMSRAIGLTPECRDTTILFGDGAGACLVSADRGFAEIVDSVICSDGAFSEALRLEFGSPMQMDGRTIILHASRKMPRAIAEVLERNRCKAADVGAFLLHQANANLIIRVAQALDVDHTRFFCNIGKYGNTSSASMLIAAAEWWRQAGSAIEAPIVFSAFGAGLHWGALLARPV